MRDESQLYDLYEEVDQGARPSRLGAALAAGVSLALLAVVVFWTYRLGVRDAYEVPVIRAVEGPARLRPEDPGGARFEHQGRAVYDALGGSGVEAAAVGLAPVAEPLAAEDVSAAERAALQPPALQPPAATPRPSQPEIAATPAPTSADEVDRLVANVLGALGAAPAEPAAAPANAPATIAPTPRPAAGAAAAAPAATVETASLPAPAVGPLIQLGAYLSASDAARMWDAFSSRNGDLLAGRMPVIALLEDGSRTLYRLRAGPFDSLEEAGRLCAALGARGEDCMVPGRN